MTTETGSTESSLTFSCRCQESLHAEGAKYVKIMAGEDVVLVCEKCHYKTFIRNRKIFKRLLPGTSARYIRIIEIFTIH